jgi:hypothetical protein
MIRMYDKSKLEEIESEFQRWNIGPDRPIVHAFGPEGF